MIRAVASLVVVLCQLSAAASTDLLRQALTLFNTGKYRESYALASQYLEQDSQSATAYKVLGMDEYMLGHTDKAVDLVARATELAPHDADALYYLARLYFTTGKMPAALDAFQKTIVVDPSSLRAYDQLGQTYEALGRTEDAEKTYVKAIELENLQPKRSEWPSYHLGVMYLDQGRTADSIRAFRHSLAINPGFVDVKIKLAVALSKDRPAPESFDLLRQAIATDPQNSEAHYRLAQLLTREGKRDEAQKEFQLFQQLKKP